jgi:hypothetical protein
MMARIAKLKICRSIASSTQPPKQAQNVVFCRGFIPTYQAVG